MIDHTMSTGSVGGHYVTFDTPYPHRVVKFLSRCQHDDGGFGGGPGQVAHLAPTYAAVLTLCTIGTQEAYNCIDRWVWYICLNNKCNTTS